MSYASSILIFYKRRFSGNFKFFSGLQFQKKFSNHWTPEVFIHAPGNEIGLIEHFWPSFVQHVKVIPSKEIELRLSEKHEISKSSECLPDI